ELRPEIPGRARRHRQPVPEAHVRDAQHVGGEHGRRAGLVARGQAEPEPRRQPGLGRDDRHDAPRRPQPAAAAAPLRKPGRQLMTADGMNGREAVRVYCTGTCEGLDKLREALSNHPELEVVGASEQVSQASSVLAGGHLGCVLHATNSPSLPVNELAAIREQTAAPIIVLASGAQSTLLEEALESDVSDVLLLPQLTENVVFAIRKASHAGRKLQAQGGHGRRGRIVTVFSPKGGTGKTSVATNLAAALAKHQGKRTLLLDLDLQFGDAAIMLGIEPEKTIYDLVVAPGELDSEKLADYTTRHQCGLDILPAPLRPDA